LTEGPQAESLPAGYSMEMEDSNLLVLRRADGSVVKSFVFSSTSPTPQALKRTAEEDLLSNQETNTGLRQRFPKEGEPAEEEDSSSQEES
jgi:hypothetical protein